jgi:hypothetical protein
MGGWGVDWTLLTRHCDESECQVVEEYHGCEYEWAVPCECSDTVWKVVLEIDDCGHAYDDPEPATAQCVFELCGNYT